jgi:general secretion pathway protein A
VDEAQSVPLDLLEEIRLLANIESNTEKLLPILLVGQPELAARLNEDALRQLKQRVALRCKLSALSLAESGAYIAGRIEMAGGDPSSMFSRDAVIAIHEAAGGIPRTISVICANALLTGYAEEQRRITRKLIEAVCRDFDLSTVAPTETPVDTDRAQVGPGEADDDIRPTEGSSSISERLSRWVPRRRLS